MELRRVRSEELPGVHLLLAANGWVLRAGREGAAEFFAKLGFEHSSMAMERRRS